VKLVVGLGNPGPQYADTRHNAGVLVLERVARELGVALGAQRFGSRFAIGRLAPAATEVALLAPLTYMNRSGSAVAAALAELPIDEPSRDVLVVLDDVDLPFGRLRLRPEGGAGGHRGLADVIDRLGRGDIPRLRFGVGRPADGQDTVDHVLDAFTPAERERLPAHVERAARAVAAALQGGIIAAMNEFNRDPDAAKADV
jgi:PTH1 family peptidyl-tRNA hydrolase